MRTRTTATDFLILPRRAIGPLPSAFPAEWPPEGG